MNSLKYVKSINNVVKNLKTALFSFTDEQITFLKNMVIALDNNKHINKYFSQTCLKRGFITKQDGKIKNDLTNLPTELNQFYSKTYIDLLEDIAKYLNDYVIVADDVKQQLLLLEEKLSNKMGGLDIVNETTEQYTDVQPHMQIMTDSIIHNVKFNRIGKLDNIALTDDFEDHIQIMERTILDKKVEESDVKDSVDNNVYDEVNRVNGFYNNNNQYKENYLGYYD